MPEERRVGCHRSETRLDNVHTIHSPNGEKKASPSPAVDEYLYNMLPARDAVLAEMEDQATKRKIPIVGPAVARILHQLALMINAKKIFEMGSAIGYSTIWWARAVGEDGKVIYTDGDQKNAQEARGYFDRAGVSKQIR